MCSTVSSLFSRDPVVSAQIFAVVDIGTTIDDDGRQWPTAVIDADGHPEITDLARVHAIEGIGDIATEAAVREGHLVIAATDPGRTSVEQPLWLAIDVDPPLLASVLPS